MLQKEWEIRAADHVDDLLESFMGIRDNELGKYVCPEAYRHPIRTAP